MGRVGRPSVASGSKAPVVAILLATLKVALSARQQPASLNIKAIRDGPLDNIAKLVLPYGYPLQIHSVQTADGFILTLMRIPHGRNPGPGASASSSVRHPHAHAHAHTRRRLRGAPDSASSASALEGDAAGPSGPSRSAARPVVFLQHGLLDSAAGYLLNGPGRSLAFLLADAGYDVWMGNVRGNTLSRRHAWLDVADASFWLWSWDQMAAYDIPAMLSYACATSGAATLDYVGHSQGTTVLLAALAADGGAGSAVAAAASASAASATVAAGRSTVQYGGGVEGAYGGGGGGALARVVRRAVLLAPVAVAKHISSVPLLAMAALGTDAMFTLLGLHEFLPSQALVAQLEGGLCALQPWACVSFLAALCGYNPDNLDSSRLPLYLSYTPAGTSVQNMAHWAQSIRSRAPNTMSYFDFGTDCSGGGGREPPGRCNQLLYGSVAPPLYNLTAITTPLAIFSGSQDRLATPLDLEYLLESLAPGVARKAVVLPVYEHLDFIWGRDAPEVLYGDVMAFLAEGREE